MKFLIVEDGFVSRRFLQSVLSQYGICDVAVNGNEAVEAFKLSCQENNRYDMVCLDILIPELDGHEVLKEIRRIENHSGIIGKDGVKIIMTTSLDDFDNMKNAFVEQCEGYLLKPIDKDKLLEKMRELKIID